MNDPRHLEESLSRLRSEIAVLDIGDEEARYRLEKLVPTSRRRSRIPSAANPRAASATG